MRPPPNAVSIPALAAVGLSPTWLYGLVERGQGPDTRAHGKLRLVSHDAAIVWLEGYLQRCPAHRRRAAEDALKDLRVARVFYRTAERRRAQHAARSRYIRTTPAEPQPLEVA
jgi:hypothetical protein